MTVLYVDDEHSAHTIFRHSIGDFGNKIEVSYHDSYKSAMTYAENHEIDCAFLDISLLDKDGITLARDLRKIQPQIEFAFITGFDEFARAAYEVGGRVYLTKPYDEKELHDALELMRRLTRPFREEKVGEKSIETNIFAKTFGSFDLLIDGEPVYFKYSKAKELLAFLVHQMGGSVSSAQIFYALWDHQAYTRDNSTYVRRAIRQLKSELAKLGIEDIIISQRNSLRLDINKISCDAWELLNGSKERAESYNKNYMSQYSWASKSLSMFERAYEKFK